MTLALPSITFLNKTVSFLRLVLTGFTSFPDIRESLGSKILLLSPLF